MLFQEKQKSSQRKIHKSLAKQFIEVPLNQQITALDKITEIGLRIVTKAVKKKMGLE